MVRKPFACLLLLLLAPAALPAQSAGAAAPQAAPPTVFGYGDFTAESRIEGTFLAVPDAQLAGRHLKILTAEPHLASTPEDRKTADYVAQKFRAAGLETEIVPYRVLMNQPKVVRVEATPGVSGSPGYLKMYWTDPRCTPVSGRQGPLG